MVKNTRIRAGLAGFAGLVGLAGSLLTSGLEARADTTTNSWPGITNVYAGPVTNNCKVSVVRTPEYKILASAGAGGTVSGTTNSWCKTNDAVSLSYSGSTGYELDHWTNVPSSVTATSSNINWNLTDANAKPWTNVTAISKAKTYNFVFEDAAAGTSQTNTASYNTYTNVVFPTYVTNAVDSGIRYGVSTIEATDVNVSTNSLP